VKYQVSLNGKPVNELLDYKSGVSMNFVPGGLVAGENVMKITAAIDTASPDYSKDKGDAVDTNLSYTVYRVEKGNTDPMAIFDDNNILVQSSPDSIAHMDDISVGPDGYIREVKFNIE